MERSIVAKGGQCSRRQHGGTLHVVGQTGRWPWQPPELFRLQLIEMSDRENREGE
ncbi:hypothetical protein PanWU01x14_307650, partial [Parasponia andersonii]